MQTRDTLKAPANRSSGPVRLGPNHGYAFDGDAVRLNADVTGTCEQPLTLQLWACDTPFDGRPVGGIKVADVALPAGQTQIETLVAACPPAGQVAHAMVLTLVDPSDGRVLDFANFPRWEHFSQPRIQGTAGFALLGEQVRLTVDGVDNPRAADNLSGTLCLELWALPAPFASNGLAGGQALAGVTLGSLAGQQSWSGLVHDLAIDVHPAGTWHLALLLREWTAAGYVTRDFTDFSIPVTWEAELAAPPTPVIEAVVIPADVAPAADEPTAAVQVVEEAAAKPASKASKKKEKSSGKVSVNTASEAELAAVKGLTKAAAAAIVAARPFKTMDDLLALKGIGKKTLEKLEGRIEL